MNHYAILEGTRITGVIRSLGAYPGGTLLAQPLDAQPSEYHEAHLIDGAVSWIDVRSLADVKAAKNIEINAWRLGATHAGFMHQGKLIATDAQGLLDLSNTGNQVARTGALPINWPGGWKAVDNSYVVIATVADWDAFSESMYQQGLANFVTAQTLKAQVLAASTIAEVDAVVWPS